LNIVNFANVRSAIGLTIAATFLLGPSSARAELTIALLPQGTSAGELAQAGLSPGLVSAGLGSVPAEQTYLDISQGNRVFDSLYSSELPRDVGGGMCGPAYSHAVVERAESAPADLVPGLLARTLASAGKSCEVRGLGLRRLAAFANGLREEDLLIAVERAPPAEGRALAIGVAGRGFDGRLTSDSTRTDGYVLSTDIAPTILARVGLPVPDEMSGRAMRAQGAPDVAAIESLGARMAAIPERRGPVIGVSLLAWILTAILAIALGRGRIVPPAVRLLTLSVLYLPLVLLLGAALEPSEGGERLLVLLGAPALAALTLVALPHYRALALASALVVLAYAVDVIVGSPWSSLSLLGPNPGLGVRFYGIGNELEAVLVVLVLAGTGAGLTGFAPRISTRARATTFLASGFLFAAIFASGRFGADVGAAIVLPLGAAVAAAAVSAGRRRNALLVIAAPLAVLALIALADLVSGANAHLTRSVLDAGGLGELADVAQRRLQLSARSFTRPVVLAFLPVLAALAGLALLRRQGLRALLEDFPAMRAGLLGALVATLFAALANDSGALLLEIGAAYLLAFTAFAWAEQPRSSRS
jgi:hypothetical protein